MEHLIELLPNDVLPNVAKFIARSPNPYPSALLFVRRSEKRRQAMIKALNFRLIFNEKERPIFQDLIALFGDSIREISLIDVVDDFFLDCIPRLPHLQRAAILCREKQLFFISRNPNVTSLEVKVHDTSGLPWLLPVFSSLRSLTHLILHVPEAEYPGEEIQKIIADACPYVETLDLRGQNICHAYFEFVKGLRSLRILSYSNSVRMYSHMDFFRTLEEVHLCCENLMKYAEFIGPPVRTLLMARTQDITELMKLERCPNLQTLLVAVEDGAEVALVGKTKNLESLDIRWGYPEGCWITKLHDIKDEDLYYEPDEGFLLSLAYNSPRLKRILLERALVPAPLLEKMIQSTGDRLEQFGVHMTGQDENVATRLEAILKSLCRHCPNIKCLLLMGMGMEIRASGEQIERCRLALSQARTRCPNLEIDKICLHINNMIPIPQKRKRVTKQKCIVPSSFY